jgi:hypothetical protein
MLLCFMCPHPKAICLEFESLYKDNRVWLVIVGCLVFAMHILLMQLTKGRWFPINLFPVQLI